MITYPALSRFLSMVHKQDGLGFESEEAAFLSSDQMRIAHHQGLVSIMHGSAWSSFDVLVSITNKGRSAIGLPVPTSWFQRLASLISS